MNTIHTCVCVCVICTYVCVRLLASVLCFFCFCYTSVLCLKIGKEKGIDFWVKYLFYLYKYMSTFSFMFFKKFLQLFVSHLFSIFTFGPSYKVISYVEFIFFNKFCRKIHNITKISHKKINFS